MSDIQKEACTVASLGSRYSAIAAVFDQLPDRFRLLDLFTLAGIKDGPRSRAAAACILYRDFKCVNVGQGCGRVWKKP